MNTSFIQLVLISLVTLGAFASLVTGTIRLVQGKRLTPGLFEASLVTMVALGIAGAAWDGSVLGTIPTSIANVIQNAAFVVAPVVGLAAGMRATSWADDSVTLNDYSDPAARQKHAIDVIKEAEGRFFLAYGVLFGVWFACLNFAGPASIATGDAQSIGSFFTASVLGSTFGLAGLIVSCMYGCYRLRKQIEAIEHRLWG